MKRFYVLVLALVMVMMLGACAKKEEVKTETQQEAITEEKEETKEETKAETIAETEETTIVETIDVSEIVVQGDMSAEKNVDTESAGEIDLDE